MNKIAIDFIGHHRIHFQSLWALINELSGTFECRELMGPNAKPTGAPIAVITDHMAYHPKVNKDNYRHLVHVSHDISDLSVYRKEKKWLKDFSLILVPSKVHMREAEKHIPKVRSAVVGWTKDDEQPSMESPVSYSQQVESIIFAWTDIVSTDWRKILAAASESVLNFKVKNHVYYEVNLGLEPPVNQMSEYLKYAEQTRLMNEFLSNNNFKNITLIDSAENLMDKQFKKDILVTDYSSAAMEFARFSRSIETGTPRRFRFPSSRANKRACSKLVREVGFISQNDLISRLPSMTISDFFAIPNNHNAPYQISEFVPHLAESSARLAAKEIAGLSL